MHANKFMLLWLSLPLATHEERGRGGGGGYTLADCCSRKRSQTSISCIFTKRNNLHDALSSRVLLPKNERRWEFCRRTPTLKTENTHTKRNATNQGGHRHGAFFLRGSSHASVYKTGSLPLFNKIVRPAQLELEPSPPLISKLSPTSWPSGPNQNHHLLTQANTTR